MEEVEVEGRVVFHDQSIVLQSQYFDTGLTFMCSCLWSSLLFCCLSCSKI